MADTNTNTNMDKYMYEVLNNAETKLSEGDYIKFADNMKKVFKLNEEEKKTSEMPEPDENGYYYIDYAKIYWKPPSNWNMLQIKYVLLGGELCTGFNSIQREDIINLEYTPKMMFRDIYKMKIRKGRSINLDSDEDDEDDDEYMNNNLINTGNHYEFNIELNSIECECVYYISNMLEDKFALICNLAFIKPILKGAVFYATL